MRLSGSPKQQCYGYGAVTEGIAPSADTRDSFVQPTSPSQYFIPRS